MTGCRVTASLPHNQTRVVHAYAFFIPIMSTHTYHTCRENRRWKTSRRTGPLLHEISCEPLAMEYHCSYNPTPSTKTQACPSYNLFSIQRWASSSFVTAACVLVSRWGMFHSATISLFDRRAGAYPAVDGRLPFGRAAVRPGWDGNIHTCTIALQSIRILIYKTRWSPASTRRQDRTRTDRSLRSAL